MPHISNVGHACLYIVLVAFFLGTELYSISLKDVELNSLLVYDFCSEKWEL